MRLVGVKGHQIAYWITNDVIPEPKLRINNKRIFVAEDIALIREVAKAKKAKKEAHAK